MLDRAKEYVVKLLKGEYTWQTFSGPTEIGKTHLLKKVKELIYKLDIEPKYSKHGYPYAIYLKGYEVTHKLLNDPNFMEDIRYAGFVFIEEFMSEDFSNVNNFTRIAVDKLFQVLNERQGKALFIDTNKSIEDLDAIDPRIASRLQRDGGIFTKINPKTKNYLSRVPKR